MSTYNVIERQTIEPDRRGDGWWLAQYGVYGLTSVLAGQGFRQLSKHYKTLKQAQSKNPGIEVLDEPGCVPLAFLPENPPDWFDPLNAGEAWHEDDY